MSEAETKFDFDFTPEERIFLLGLQQQMMEKQAELRGAVQMVAAQHGNAGKRLDVRPDLSGYRIVHNYTNGSAPDPAAEKAVNHAVAGA